VCKNSDVGARISFSNSFPIFVTTGRVEQGTMNVGDDCKIVPRKLEKGGGLNLSRKSGVSFFPSQFDLIWIII
jgi:hypothetical protein